MRRLQQHIIGLAEDESHERLAAASFAEKTRAGDWSDPDFTGEPNGKVSIRNACSLPGALRHLGELSQDVVCPLRRGTPEAGFPKRRIEQISTSLIFDGELPIEPGVQLIE